MNYPYKYHVIGYLDCKYSEAFESRFFCDFVDAEHFYTDLAEDGYKVFLYRIMRSDNLNDL